MTHHKRARDLGCIDVLDRFLRSIDARSNQLSVLLLEAEIVMQRLVQEAATQNMCWLTGLDYAE